MSTKSNPKKDYYFRESRKYYFEKYYGKTISYFVDFMLNLNKWQIIFVFVVILVMLFKLLERKI